MTATPILQPGQIEAAAGDIPELRIPPATLFANRAQRLRQLAEGHSLADYLHFLATLSECQQNELEQHPEIPVPDANLLANCREHTMPPLAPDGWPCHPHWQIVSRKLADGIAHELPADGLQALSPFLADNEWLAAQAHYLLQGKVENLDLAAAPIIGAALQVQWTHLVQQLEPQQVGLLEQPAICPVCGSHPVASVIRTDASAKGLRYLHCVLCGSEWHVVRSKCSQCDNTQNIGYYGIEGKAEVVRAEACPACRSYLKVLQQEKDVRVDPVADDIATLALDLLMGEIQYAGSGINFFMMQRNSSNR